MLLRLLSIIACVGLISACGSSEEADSSGGANADKPPLRIAAIPARVGATAEFGEHALAAIKFAADEANRNGGVNGHEVEVFPVETDATPDATVRAARRAVTQDRAQYIIGAMSSAEQAAVQQQLAGLGALAISAIPSADALTGENCSEFAFRTRQNDHMSSVAVAEALGDKLKERWAIQATDNVTGHTSAKNFKERVEAAGGRIVAEKYSPLGASDFSSNIVELRKSNATGLFVAEYGADAVAFVNQGAQFKLFDEFETVVGSNFISEALFKALGDKILGFYNDVTYASSVDTPRNAEFVEAWEKKHGERPMFIQGSTYLGMQVLFAAVEKADSVDPAKVKDALSTITTDTILGEVTMRPEDHQLLAPTYVGRVVEKEGDLQWEIVESVPADVTTPEPNPDCKL